MCVHDQTCVNGHVFVGRSRSVLTHLCVTCSSCTKAQPINQIHLRGWMKMKGWMKEEGTETMTAKRRRKNDTDNKNDIHLCGKVKRPKGKEGTEQENNKEGTQAPGRKR